MATLDKLEELNLTQDEITRFTEALRKPEFKELLYEYAQEISDPENRARYEMEIRQMENERGMDIKFLNPEPGYVIKTTISGDRKAFINVCKNDLIGKPSSTKQTAVDGRPGLCWSLPHSFTPPREDVSKTGVRCTVFDFVVHPDTYRMAETNPRFKSMVNDTALEGIKKMFDVEVDFKNLRFPKIKYKGSPTASVIRDKLQESTEAVSPDDLSSRFAYPYDNKTTEEKSKEIMERNEKAQALKAKKEKKENKQTTENEFSIPKYVIKYQSDLDIQDFLNSADARNATLPKNLIIEVDLPLLQSANPITLDVFEKRLSLVSHQPAKYKLDISLAYPVDENEGSAKFDKNRRKLIVTLPVVRGKNMLEMPFDGKTFKDDSDQVELEDSKIERESNGVRLMCKTEQVRPLIEVISEKESEPAAVDHSYTSTNGEQTALASANSLHQEYGNLSRNVVYLLPDFECQQDDSSLLFTFGTKKVKKESLLSNVLSDNAISVKMTSVGSGGFPVYYGCCLKFDDDCYIDVNNCQLNFNGEKEGVSLLITKDSRSNGWWKSYSVGVDMDQLEERGLEMMTRTLPPDSAETSFQTSLSSDDVIELDVKKVLDPDHPVMGSESVKPEGISTEMEVAVVHDQGSPELHGILKQHSASESSDSSDSASTIHIQNSDITSGIEAEDVVDSLTGASPCALKKSVSFSEQVDVFLENQATLKNQEKNVRKCRKRQKSKKQEQRKSNVCCSVGSGDDQSDAQNTGVVSQVNKNKTMSDAALVVSKSGETDTEVGRGHVNRNNSAVHSVANNVAKSSEGSEVRNNFSSADETTEGTEVGEEICYESVEKGESRDCRTSEGEGSTTVDQGSFKIIQTNKENKSLTSDDCSVSQLNASTENSSVADQQRPDDLKPHSAIPILCDTQKSSSASVNIERKTNLMVEMKNKFVFDLDVD